MQPLLPCHPSTRQPDQRAFLKRCHWGDKTSIELHVYRHSVASSIPTGAGCVVLRPSIKAVKREFRRSQVERRPTSSQGEHYCSLTGINLEYLGIKSPMLQPSMLETTPFYDDKLQWRLVLALIGCRQYYGASLSAGR